ncbi:MAG: site-specific DNA-methyltransferase [Reyranella sp.]|uniref:site-specific DNA-methyltransferase n=1 Tax=Reyranella sp. TaxID=1929291 RepID=UPI003D0A6336
MSKTDGWPAFQVERRAVLALKPYKNNARTHSEEQVAQIAASIREWGWTQPILVDEKGGVLAGHGRLLAAQSLGIDEVPVIVARGWSKAQKRAYVLADNQLALNAGWDRDLLKVEIGALQDVFDVGLLGFPEDFLADVMADRSAGLTDPDDAPAVPVNPVSRKGDLWLCGSHRLLCGDSTSAEAVDRLLGGVKPHLMVTDPPYGVEYDANWRNERVRSDGTAIAGRAVGKVLNDGEADWRGAYELFRGDVAYAWSADLRSREAIEGLEAAGFEIRAQIIWAKQQFAIGRGHYHFQHEPCWYAVRKGATGHWNGDRKQSTLWQIDKPQASETGHSTQKPVECMRRPIVNNSSPGQAVYDPFCGSGTTMIAAEMEGRAAYCMELSEAYCDVIVNRWQAFTGKEATLDGGGRTFAEIDSERYDPAKDSAACYEVAIADKRRKRLEAAE